MREPDGYEDKGDLNSLCVVINDAVEKPVDICLGKQIIRRMIFFFS